MQLSRRWRRKKRSGADAEVGAAVPDRRTAEWRCRNCQTKEGPFIYFENGKHYCESCAGAVGGYIGIRTAGRRHDDITRVPPPDE